MVTLKNYLPVCFLLPFMLRLRLAFGLCFLFLGLYSAEEQIARGKDDERNMRQKTNVYEKIRRGGNR